MPDPTSPDPGPGQTALKQLLRRWASGLDAPLSGSVRLEADEWMTLPAGS